MKYPQALTKGGTIGVCAPSSGVTDDNCAQLDTAIRHVQELGYMVIETASVRQNAKCVSTDSATRAREFMELYENPAVQAIIPPWGGEFLLDMLPCLDFERIGSLPPKWVCGYSDTSTLLFSLTTRLDIATIHGSSLMNMGFRYIHSSDMTLFTAMEGAEITQESAPQWGRFTGFGNTSVDPYILDRENPWKSFSGKAHSFSGRMIGGCVDVIARLIGTEYAPVEQWLGRYKEDGFIWAIENCEMNAADLYRSLWQMREAGWFRGCNGVLFGRFYKGDANKDFTLIDALREGLGPLDVPVIYDADIGHTPPLTQIVNGAMGTVDFANGRATVKQIYCAGRESGQAQ